MRTRKSKKLKITKGERLLYLSASICLGLTLVLKIFLSANIGNLGMNVETLKYEINSQNKKNESLTMKVNELTSFDTVKEVVKQMGLEYNYDNIIIINE